MMDQDSEEVIHEIQKFLRDSGSSKRTLRSSRKKCSLPACSNEELLDILSSDCEDMSKRTDSKTHCKRRKLDEANSTKPISATLPLRKVIKDNWKIRLKKHKSKAKLTLDDLKLARSVSLEYDELQVEGFSCCEMERHFASENGCFELAKVTAADVRYHPEIACIDLTTEQTISEKQCAAEVLPIVYKCYKLYAVRKQISSEVLHDEGCLALEDYVLKWMQDNTVSLREDFVQTLAKYYVKNLDLLRFLDVLAAKLAQSHAVNVQREVVAYFLFLLLPQKLSSGHNELLVKFKTEFDAYMQHFCVKFELDFDKEL